METVQAVAVAASGNPFRGTATSGKCTLDTRRLRAGGMLRQLPGAVATKTRDVNSIGMKWRGCRSC